jgi:Phosphatidylinositol-4-phosphate 5-Kinase
MYRVKLFHLRRNVKFVIMNSVYYTDKYLQSFYDLKGSVTGRSAKPGQDVKKDNDLKASLPEGAIALIPSTRVCVRRQIVADCEFMKEMKIMDYSLLIGVHHIPPTGTSAKKDRSCGTTGFRFSDARKESTKFREILRSSLKDIHSRGHRSLPSSFSVNTESASRAKSLPENYSSREDARSKAIVLASQRLLLHKGISAPTLTMPEEGQTMDLTKDSEKHFAQLAMYEYGLDDDDDNSYLEGSDKNPVDPKKLSNKELKSLEVKKEQTIEQVYWPFHRLYDIHGYRRMIPGRFDSSRADPIRNEPKIGAFVKPLSDRKDGGLMMDTTGLELPIKFKTPNGREHLCEGKVFYVGIIDILQQYNTRKRLESRYRRLRGAGWQDASCVHPDIYAERFVRFFDEYSQRSPV